MIKLKNILILVVIIFLIERLMFIKNGYCYYGNNGIKVTELLVIHSRNNKLNYCDSLRKSFYNDKNFISFVRINVADASVYDHAYVLYQLKDYYGDSKFWKKIDLMNEREKRKLELEFNYIEQGLY